MKSPLPEVPSPQPDEQVPLRAVPSAVRAAMLLLVAFGIANIVREATYVIGAIQSYGHVGWRDVRGVIRAVVLLVTACLFAWRLGQRDEWAWWMTVIGSLIYSLKLGWELFYLMSMRARGYTNTEVQIVLLIAMLGMLVTASLYLLSRGGRAPFGYGPKPKIS